MSTSVTPTENQLQIACIDYLKVAKLPGVIFCHVPNEGLRTKGQNIHLVRMGMLPGWPDLQIIDTTYSSSHGNTLVDCRMCFVEFKVGHNSLSENQDKVRGLLTGAGLSYAVIRNVDRFIDLMTEWDLVRDGRRQGVADGNRKS